MKNRERDFEIFRLRKEQYLNLKVIGDRLGLSQERVRVIVNDLEKQGYNVQNFRAARDGENDQTS
jgi:biotin operon repressor|tara:strand:- start:160 stop:354 length:195 start_codon:yes stop_codon:yes gene_type:complete